MKKNISLFIRSFLIASSLLAFGVSSRANFEQPTHISNPGELTADTKPKDFDGIGIKENLGQKLNLGLQFRDEAGQLVSLGSFYDGKRPVVISLIYFSCPGLCNFHLNGVIDAIKPMDWSPGQQFEYVVISFDPNENSELATAKKETYMQQYNRPGTEKGWHFLTADQSAIDQITKQIGFNYKWDAKAKEWAHASAAVITTPDATISRYLHGIMFDEKTFKLSLSEATNGKIGNIVDQLIWYCFKYDPQQSTYVLYAFRLMQIGGLLTVLVLAAFLIPVWIRSRREQV